MSKLAALVLVCAFTSSVNAQTDFDAQKVPTIVLPSKEKEKTKEVESKKSPYGYPPRPVILGTDGKPTPYGRQAYGYPPRAVVVDPANGNTTPHAYPPRWTTDPVTGRPVFPYDRSGRYRFDPATGQAYPAVTSFGQLYRYPATYRYRYRVNLPTYRFRATYRAPNMFMPYDGGF